MYLALEQASRHVSRIVMIGSGAEYGFQRYTPEMDESYYDINEPPANNHPYHISSISYLWPSNHPQLLISTTLGYLTYMALMKTIQDFSSQ